MKTHSITPWRVLALLLTGAALAACDSPTEPGDDVNAALAAEVNGAGIASALGTDLPQGSVSFTGPGGLAMEAAGKEFVQQLTLRDGTVLRTSGITVFAVPNDGEPESGFDLISFGAAHTGSLTSVQPGTYELPEAMPPFDFIDPVLFGFAQLRETGEPGRHWLTSGKVTIESVEYFPDVYTCEAKGTALTFTRCDYQLGLVRGVIEFEGEIQDGSVQVVQPTTSFTVPIKRETIVAVQN